MIIYATGPSAAGYIPPAGVQVIAVNAALDYTRADYWFSLDPSPANRRILARWCHYPNVKFVIADDAGMDRWQTSAPVWRLDRVSRRSEEPLERDSVEWAMWRQGAVPKVSQVPSEVHTGNSAWGALQVAYKLGARRVVLVGVDGTQDPKLDGLVPGDLRHLGALFASALAVMQVRRLERDAVSVHSRMTLPTIREADVAAWVTGALDL